ncbi:hypothetical protein AMJ44_05340, partial [candidate division WOR-1 bacterium DG_54_3]
MLLALAFPKFNLYWLAWIALVPFFIALRRSKGLGESLLCGLFFGIFFFGIHLSWVTSLFRFVEWWIILGWAALVLYQTLFIFLFVILLRFINPRRVLCAVPIAFLWVIVELLRAWGPFGVTGGDLGYSQAQLLPLIQIASFASVYGVSFLLALVNVTVSNLFITFMSVRNKLGEIKFFPTVLVLVLVLALVIGCYAYGLWVMATPSPIPHPSSLKLALIQPNVDQEDKLDPSKVMPIFELHEEMTHQAMEEKPEIIIWPETAIFSYLLYDSRLLPRVKQLAIDSKAWLIFGTPHYIGDKAYNSVVSMSPSGEIVSRYDKQQLVPFGEYLPFRRILFPLLKGVGYYDYEFSSNPDPELLSAADLKIAAAICFESTFPYLIRERVKKSSDFILTVTNDAWFGNSSATYFHLNTGVFRAIENRRYFIQVGNTGLTAVIDPYGRILK